MLAALRRWAVPCLLIGLFGCDVVLGLDDYDPSATTGAGGSAAGGADGRCGGLGVLADDFSDGELTPGWLEVLTPGTSITERDGLAAIYLPVPGGSAHRVTAHHHDMRDDYVVVEVSQVPAIGTVWFQVVDDYDPTASLTIRANAETFSYEKSGLELGDVDYDAVAHRFWRIRHAADPADLVYVETAPAIDGPWDEHYSTAPSQLFDPRYTLVAVGLSASGLVDDGQGAKLESINGGAARQTWCKAETFADPFDDDSAGAAWNRSELANCTVNEVNGEVALTFINNGGRCQYLSSTAFDLTESSFSLRIRPDAAAPQQYYLTIAQDDENRVDVQTGPDDLSIGETVDDVDMALTSLAIPTDEYWRLRAEGVALVFETSPAGSDWVEAGRVDVKMPLDAVHLGFGMGDQGPGAGVVFSELNGGTDP